MNTPSHVVIGLAAFARPGAPGVTAAAVAGSLAPDLSLYFMSAWAMLVLDIPARVVFDELYFSDVWQGVFAVDNSFIVWGCLLVLGLVLSRGWLIAFAGAAILHLAFDFPFHNDDARAHFWPLTDWVFVSPLSYWDRRHFGTAVGAFETGLVLILCVVLFRRFRPTVARLGIVTLGAFQIAPSVIWGFVF